MDNGYIKIARSTAEDPMYLQECFTRWQAWCDLILLAYPAPSNLVVRGIKIRTKKGCVYIGMRNMAERWKWSVGKVSRFLSSLQKEGRIKVKSNNVINCIVIQGYEDFIIIASKREGPAKSKRKTIVETKQTETKNDVPDVIEQADMFTSPEVVINEEKTEAKPKKKVPNPLIVEGRKVFERKFLELFNADYYWQAKDAASMKSLTQKIVYSREKRGMSIEVEDVMKALEALLDSISDPWILKNFSMCNISSKYNEIVAQAKLNISQSNQSYGTNNSTKAEEDRRANDAASLVARLAEKESTDDSALWRKN